jgi:hypothetical protein
MTSPSDITRLRETVRKELLAAGLAPILVAAVEEAMGTAYAAGMNDGFKLGQENIKLQFRALLT